jgi:hypothetical protein
VEKYTSLMVKVKQRTKIPKLYPVYRISVILHIYGVTGGSGDII